MRKRPLAIAVAVAGVTGRAAGSTPLVLSNSDGGIPDVKFTVEVSSH
ncbi:hypothetical protein [Microbacterium pumilum]